MDKKTIISNKQINGLEKTENSFDGKINKSSLLASDYIVNYLSSGTGMEPQTLTN